MWIHAFSTRVTFTVKMIFKNLKVLIARKKIFLVTERWVLTQLIVVILSQYMYVNSNAVYSKFIQSYVSIIIKRGGDTTFFLLLVEVQRTPAR